MSFIYINWLYNIVLMNNFFQNIKTGNVFGTIIFDYLCGAGLSSRTFGINNPIFLRIRYELLTKIRNSTFKPIKICFNCNKYSFFRITKSTQK